MTSTKPPALATIVGVIWAIGCSMLIAGGILSGSASPALRDFAPQFTLLGGIVIVMPFVVLCLYFLYRAFKARHTGRWHEFGWRRYIHSRADVNRSQADFCVVCNSEWGLTAHHEYGREFLFAGFVLRRRVEGTVAECSDCHEADEIDVGLRWDKHDLLG